MGIPAKGASRLSLSPKALTAWAEFKKRMGAIGATVATDDMANMCAAKLGTENCDVRAYIRGAFLLSTMY